MAHSSHNNNRRLAIGLCAVVLAMFGFGYALVPLYEVFCDITGINGKTATEAASDSQGIDRQRTVTVEFIARVQSDMPWQFAPEINSVQVHPGQSHQMSFKVKNLSSDPTVGQAIPSVSPGLGAQYFSKIECFCFNQQPLEGGQTADLGLLFYLDEAIPEHIHTVTLSYTLYNITDTLNSKGSI